jgi:hypothetical protein
VTGLARDPAAMEAVLRGVQPAVRVVRERHLRRLVGLLRDDGDEVTFHPDQPLGIDRDRLLAFDILPDETVGSGPDRLVLVADPRSRLSAARHDAEVLRDYWRLLVRVEAADRAADRFTPGSLTEALGPATAGEVRFVVEDDRLVPTGAGEAAVFRTFVAVLADRLLFAPHTLPLVFPSLPNARGALEPLLGIPLDALAGRLRPAGAADPEPLVVPADIDPDPTFPAPDADDGLSGRAAALTGWARAAAASGNHVRAAILRTRVAHVLAGPDRAAAEAAARSALHDGLVARLGAVLGWDYATSRRWTRALTPLLVPAAAGVWPRAARALYDLQKIPSDLGRELFAIDPAGWVGTLGQQSIRRPLTRAKSAILLRHLSTADHHLARVRLPADDRDRLHHLVRDEMHKAEAAVRADLSPVFCRALDAAGLRPANLLERVSRDKLVAELADRVCDKGYLRFADLRDAVARNQLKMPDLSGPGEFLRGDALLRADAVLADELVGVYRRGEVYLRWIQRLTAAAFGTRVGRWLSRYVILPFGGGVMTVEFAKYVNAEVRHVRHWLAGLDDPPPPEPDPFAAEAATPFDLPAPSVETVQHEAVLGPASLTAAVLLGVVYLGLLHVRPFRYAVGSGLSAVGRALRAGLIDLPAAVWRMPLVRTVRRHPASRFVSRRFGAGFVVGALAAGGLAAFGYNRATVVPTGLATALVVTAVAATSAGRAAEDRVIEYLAAGWRKLRVNLLPGLVSSVVWAFRWLAGAVERALYSVDELFRFRAGQSAGSLALKVALACLWFPVAYLTRFAFYLLLEPQINPLKHFPVVTVSHKLLLPLVPGVSSATGLNEGTVFLLIACVPGIFGFIAWELKENWRLYAANRPARTPPAVLGHHGETMRGLLRPGFHSGTVPKAFARLRREVRDAELAGRPAAGGKWEHEIEEVGAAVAATAERELVPLLRSAPCWAEGPPTVGEVRVGVQAVEVDFDLPGAAGRPLRLAFEHDGGRITAHVVHPGWAADLGSDQQKVLGVGLGGLAEAFAATWRADTNERVAALVGELRARDWGERVRYWDGCGTKSGAS